MVFKKDRGILKSFLIAGLVIVFGLILLGVGLLGGLPLLFILLIMYLGFKTLVRYGFTLRCIRFILADVLSYCLRNNAEGKFWHSRFIFCVNFTPKCAAEGQSNLCRIFFIPQLEDNICYLTVDLENQIACVVDCADAWSVIYAVRKISKGMLAMRRPLSSSNPKFTQTLESRWR